MRALARVKHVLNKTGCERDLLWLAILLWIQTAVIVYNFSAEKFFCKWKLLHSEYI